MKASLSALIFHEASLLVTQVVENASEQVLHAFLVYYEGGVVGHIVGVTDVESATILMRLILNSVAVSEAQLRN